jgi:hypothetical protein
MRFDPGTLAFIDDALCVASFLLAVWACDTALTTRPCNGENDA